MENSTGIKRTIDENESIEVKKQKTDIEVGFKSQVMLLNNGGTIPQIQFGTYKMKGDACYKGVLSALRLGYCGLDTASMYSNEKECGKAIVDSGIPREQLYIQTKLWRSFTGKGKNGKPLCDAELRKSLRNLGTSYIDLWLMHWPGPGRHLNYPPVRMGMSRPKQLIPGNKDKMVPLEWKPERRLETYASMCNHVARNGIVRAVGICNFSVRQLKQLLDYCAQNDLPKPAVLQNECHPYLIAKPVRDLCKEHKIVFQAYASLGAGAIKILEDSVVTKLAQTYDVTPAQILLRWAIQHNLALLPKSVNPKRQEMNLQVYDFKLTEEDMKSLDDLNQGEENQNTMVGWLREHDPDFY